MKCLLLLFLVLVLTGCGVSVGVSANQITLAIYSPLCVDVMDASTASGAHIQAYPCGAGKRSQEWKLIPVSDNSGFNIVNLNSQMCMSVLDSPETAPGQYVVQETCVAPDTQPNQVWNIIKAPASEAGYQLISAASKECLDLPYGAAASIFDLQQYYCTADDPAQGWNLNPVPQGNIP